MPRLYVRKYGITYTHAEPGQPTPRDVFGLRLFARVLIGRPVAPAARKPRYVILDTGASLSIFPYVAWQPLAPDIEWLYRPATATAPTVALPLNYPPGFPAIPHIDAVARGQSTILDGPFPALLGRVRVEVGDQENNYLPAASVVCLFRLDFGSKLKEPVLGMSGGIFDDRRVVRDTMSGKNEYMERLRHPDDFGPLYNQVWHLSVP